MIITKGFLILNLFLPEDLLIKATQVHVSGILKIVIASVTEKKNTKKPSVCEKNR